LGLLLRDHMDLGAAPDDLAELLDSIVSEGASTIAPADALPRPPSDPESKIFGPEGWVFRGRPAAVDAALDALRQVLTELWRRAPEVEEMIALNPGLCSLLGFSRAGEDERGGEGDQQDKSNEGVDASVAGGASSDGGMLSVRIVEGRVLPPPPQPQG